MAKISLSAIGLIGTFVYLNETGASQAAMVLTVFAAFYLVIMAFLMRE